jgi:adenylate cyclase
MWQEATMYGELVPVGGGDNIGLYKPELVIGRRESCDIILRWPNVSTYHCKLELVNGYWYVKDQGSKNGTKVNGHRVNEKRLDPGDTLSVARHEYEIHYSPADLGAVGPPPTDTDTHKIFGKSLLERAGLERKGDKEADTQPAAPRKVGGRYDILSNEPGQIRRPDDTV